MYACENKVNVFLWLSNCFVILLILFSFWFHDPFGFFYYGGFDHKFVNWMYWFFKCHCIMLQLTICGVTISCTISTILGCMWRFGTSFVLNSLWSCLEPELWHWLFMGALQFQLSICWDIQEKLAFQIVLNNLAKDDIFEHELKELDILLM